MSQELIFDPKLATIGPRAPSMAQATYPRRIIYIDDSQYCSQH